MNQREFSSIAAFARELANVAARSEPSLALAAEAGALVVERNTRAVFGDNTKLETLAESTQAERVRLGYSANEPELRSGALRDTVEHEVDGNEAVIGSADPVALFQEFGFITREGVYVPPRPSFEIGLYDSEEELVEVGEAAVFVTFGFESPEVIAEARQRRS